MLEDDRLQGMQDAQQDSHTTIARILDALQEARKSGDSKKYKSMQACLIDGYCFEAWTPWQTGPANEQDSEAYKAQLQQSIEHVTNRLKYGT